METIRNFLNSMFMNLPQTEDVLRAKRELESMMEDKYNELKQEGKTENEAVGIVISEFGNLEELADELGISGYMNSSGQSSNKGITITLQEAQEYVDQRKKSSIKIAIGVFLCIISPITLILLGGLCETDYLISEGVASCVGVTMLLLLVAVAVAIFITTGISMEKYKFMEEQVLNPTTDVIAYARGEKESYRTTFATGITIGVVLCIISVLPVLFTSIIDNELIETSSVCAMLFIVAIAVVIFIVVGTKHNSFEVLLQEGDYCKEKKEDKVTGAIAAVYWPLVTFGYLAYNFITMDWGRSWIVWPLAGILFGVIASIIGICRKDEK